MNLAENWTRFGCIATILLLFGIFPVTGHAQGSLESTVRDGATNQGVRGAQVFISALSIGRLSDADGSFQIGGIPAGTHVVEIRLIGYATERQEVSIADGQVTQLDVTISEEAIALAGIVAIGTRARPRTVTESAVPVDVITNAEIINQGDTDFANLLRNVVPSFNVNIQPISDAATFARPANLRGLAPDHTLILVNGKHRHRTAVITWYGNGLADGSQGPDIAMIPGMALEQAEVLRDGASAQYGSDAIAGVMNFVLNNNRSGGALEIKTGGHLFATTSEPFQDDPIPGDGEMYSIAGNIGLPLGETGFLNLTGEYGNTNPTDRSVQRNDALALVGAGNQHVRSPTQIWGSPHAVEELVPGRVPHVGAEAPVEGSPPSGGVFNVHVRRGRGPLDKGPKCALRDLQDFASVQVPDHGERHRLRHVIAFVKIGDVLGGDALEASPAVVPAATSGFHLELTLPKIAGQEPGRVEQRPHAFEELTRLCVDLQSHWLTVPLHNVGSHQVRGYHPG